ncbi:Tryptophan synthase [Penicillium digitatum]|uniref:tryptophan synthase n=1 Tax=Penicillium digitatum TaxID=36651 RepID=A0A7T6XQK5_PENDI|nr:Tryptophan synthase [Penicillium digitatum]
MEAIHEALAKDKAKNHATWIPYVTAGYPAVSETPGMMLSMQAGGADIIKLGIPFTDPGTESPTIQQANAKALANGVQVSYIQQTVKSARKPGLAVPVPLAGYKVVHYRTFLSHFLFHPERSYGDDLQDR